MNKKELRKELELILLKSLEEVLNKRNVEATKKIRKITHEAAKIVAKKFLKTIPPVKENKTVSSGKIIKKKIIPLKKVAKKTIISFKKAKAPSSKKVLQKIRSKTTK